MMPNRNNSPLSNDPLIGQQLGPFRVERVIGRGGMAQVYYGWDVKLNRPVALKVIDARYRDDPTYAKRFVQEAQSVATWTHENIIKVYYGDDQDGLYYYAMEYVDGRDLAQLLAAYAADKELMPHADVVGIGRVIASALDYAHQRGVIHRDVKPSNVMVARDGRVVLGDFGLALDVQLGSLGEAFGSPHYMAPEQARRSTEAVPQSDLYSLGVMLYEMLTGAVPFDDPSPTTVALQHMTLPPTPPRALNPRLSEATEAVLLKALSKDPAARFATGQALMEALAASLTAAPPANSAPVPLPPAAQRPLSQVAVEARVAAAPPSLAAGRAAPGTQPRRTQGRAWPLAALALLLGAAGVACLVLAVLPRLGPAVEPAQLTATALAQGGRSFVALYDDNSFYLLNLSRDERDIAPIAFERLTANGQPADRFEGEAWAELFPTLMPGVCNGLEILDSPPYRRPAECFEGYLSTRTPQRADPSVFWTAREGSEQFRVLWEETEVGRCEIGAGVCRVYLP